MATKAAHKRVRILPLVLLQVGSQQALHILKLTKEFVVMQREPPPFVWACPDEKNILTCKHRFLLSPLLAAQNVFRRELPHREPHLLPPTLSLVPNHSMS